MTLFFIALATFCATLVGGYFALRFRDHLHLILGFSAGAVIGVAFFDLLPEAIELNASYHEPSTLAFVAACGFLIYLVLDRLILLHTHDEGEHGAPRPGALGALTLSAHSFLDGVAIGVGFQVAPAVGLIVAVAVLTHDFSDGINTVNVVLRGGAGWREAFSWLIVDALAPVLGITLTLFFIIPESALGLVLALFVGTFLYLGAADLIPESHHRHPRAFTTFMTLLGAGLLYLIVKFAGG